MKVVDASAIIDALTANARAEQLLAILDDDLFAPDLLVPEVYSFLRRMAAHDRLTATAADQLAVVLQQAPIEFVHTWPYSERIWLWRHTMSPYDATYVALAEDLGAPLVTTDVRLARAATGVVPVIVV